MSRDRLVGAASIAILMLAMSGRAGTAQSRTDTQNPDSTQHVGDPRRNEDPFAGKLAEQQARNRNLDRQERLVSDTDRLLSLATQLKQEVDKTDKDTLSVDVVKKAEEIEKLAHSVKEKMKGGA